MSLTTKIAVTSKGKSFWGGLIAALACLAFMAQGYAQDDLPVEDSITEIEIDRDAADLGDLLSGNDRPNTHLAPLLDTAMILTAAGPNESVARCVARNARGEVSGRVRVRIPGHGVRFFLLSDIVDDRALVANVNCHVSGIAVGTEIMLGVITSDIQVHQEFRAGRTHILFPVTALR